MSVVCICDQSLEYALHFWCALGVLQRSGKRLKSVEAGDKEDNESSVESSDSDVGDDDDSRFIGKLW